MKTIFYNSTKAVKLFLSSTIAPKVTKRLALLVFFFFASVSIFGQQSTITISTSATSGGSFTGTAPNKVFTPSASTANIQASALVTELLTNNVTINTALVGGTGTGNVTFNTALTVAPTGTTQRTFTINAGGSITVSNAINLTPSGSGGTNNTARPGHNVSFTAGTSISVAAAITTTGNQRGSVSGGNAGSISLTAGTTVAVTGGALTANGAASGNSNGGDISLTGPGGITLTQNLTATANGTGTAGAFTLNDGSSTVTTGGGVNDGQTAGVISGGTLTKSGNGTFVMARANTYIGLTTVSAGVLNIQNATATGTTAGGVTVTSGAALQVQGGITVGAEALTLNGTGISSDGALRSVGTGNLTNTWGGTITLGSTVRINANASSTLSMGAITGTNRNLFLGGIGNMVVTGAITTGTGSMTDDGPGTVTFSGTNTYSGATTIEAGITSLGASNVFANNSNLVLNGGTFKTGTSTGYSDSMGTLTLGASSTFAFGGTSHTMTFSASNAVTWAGTVLTVNGWTGTAGSSGTAGQIIVGTTSSGLTSAQLAKFSFTGYGTGAVQLSTGEVVPAPAPEISSATTASSTYGTASSYTITGSNTPTSYGATELPTGMSVDTATGVITVAASTAAGTYSITISAINGSGTGSTTLTYTVNTKALTITGLTGSNKVYDGTTSATATGTAALSGLVLSQTVTLGGTPTYTFASANVGTGISISTTGYTISGAAAVNYTLTQPTLSANITVAALSVTASAQSKTYGSTAPTSGTLNTNFTVSGLQGTDAASGATLGYSGSTAGNTATAVVGSYTITPSALTLSSGSTSNYSISYTTGSLTVNAATLTVTASAQSKNYGSTVPTSGILNTNFTVSGLQNSDAVSGATLGYSGSPAGNLATATAGAYTITPSAVTLSSGLTSNYSISYVTGTLTVNAVTLTVTASAQSKTYGSTAPTSGTLTTNFTVSGLLGTDEVSGVTLGYSGSPAGNLGTAAVGSYTITPSALTLSSGSASNYSIIYNTATLTVNTAALTITGLTANNKTYDGTTAATFSGTEAYSGLQNGESFTVSGTPTTSFATASVGNGKTVTFSGYTVPNSNYTLTQPTTTANITAATLTITADDVVKVFNTTLTTPVTTSTAFLAEGLVNDETVGSVGITYGTGATATAAIGTYADQATPSAATGGTFTAANYTITYVSGNILVGNARYSAASGNWNATTTWATTSGGTAGASVPVEGDLVFIDRNRTVTVTANAACGSLQLGRTGSGTSGTGTLTMNPNISLSVNGNVTMGGSGNTGSIGTINFAAGSSISVNNLTLGNAGVTPARGVITMTSGGTLTVNGDITVNTVTGNTWTPGTGTLVLANTTTLPSTIFTSFNNLTINSGATVTSGASFSVGGIMTVNGSFVPGATTHVISGAGTLTGSGSIDVNLVSATALTSQYSVTTKTLTNLMVDYAAAGNQSMFADTYGAIKTSGSGTKTLLGITTINNNITIGSGTTLNAATFTSSVKGNWENNGTFTPSTSTIQFTGASAQHIIGTSSSTFNNLTINNSTGVSLSGSLDATVNGTLTLTSGLVSPNANSFTVGSAGTISGASPTSYINGALKRVITGTSATSFPVGKGGNYRPATFTYASAPGTKTVTIEQFESSSPLSIATASTDRFGTRYWNITQSVTGVAYTVGLNNSSLTPTGSAVILRREGTGSTTQNTTTFSTPNYANSSSFSTTNISNDIMLAETAIPLTVTGATTANKEYDGTNTATLTGGTLVGIVGSDVVTLTQSGTFAQTGVGTSIGITSTSTIGGANASAYTLTQPSLTARNITAKALTVTGATTANKEYDGTNTATITGGTLVGIVGSDVVALSQSGTFGQTGVGTSVAITSTSTISGTNSGNYSLTQPSLTARNITAKALTVTGATTANKEYDGTNTATITGGTLVGIVGSDVVTLTQSGTFAQTGVGTSIAITSTSTISGTNSGNYSLTQPSLTARNITAKNLTITGLTGSNKVYDGNTNATVTGTEALSEIVSPDVVTLSGTPTFTFASANVGTEISIATTGYSLAGANSGNYTLTQPTLSANITQATPTVTPTVGTYTYNGSAQGPNAATNTGTGTSYTYSYVGTQGTNYTASATQPTNAGRYFATVTVGANGNFQSASSSATAFTISKANPIIIEEPSTSSIIRGNSLTSSNLIGGQSDVAGTFAFASPSVMPSPGRYFPEVIFIPNDTTNYNTVSTTTRIEVIKATPTITNVPTASTITYGQTLASSTLSGGSASVEGTFDFTTPSTAPNAGTESQGVTFTPTDTTNYNTVTSTINVAVNKATPTATLVVSNSPATYSGSAQSATVAIASSSVAGAVSAILTGGSATQTAAGTYAVTASFVPTDSANYNTLTLQSAGNFVINKATTTTVVTISAGVFGYTGLAQTPATVTVTGAGGLSLTPTAVYTNNTNAGTATASYAYAGDDNYLSSSDSEDFTIGKATTTTVVTINGGPFAYTGSVQTPATVTVTGAGGLSLTPTAVYTNNTNAGTATASYTYAETANYLSSSDSANFTIGKAVTTTTVTVNGGPFGYTGLAQTPATVTVTGAGGLNLTPTADYANNTNAGTATASYTYAGDDNYLSSSDSEDFTIGKAATTTTVTVNGGPFAYTESAQTPATVTVTGAGGLSLTPTADYTNNTNAGTATASYAYAGDDNYLSSSDSANFTIGKATTTTVVTISEGPFGYTGSAQTPATVVITGAGGLSLTPTAVYTNNTNAGTATASYAYAGDNNYLSSSDSENFTIGKATTTTTVTVNGGPFAYTGSAQTPATVIVTGTGGLNLTPTADYTNNTNAGTATASYAYAGDSNYLSSSDSANFTIGKATTTTVVTISEGPFAYTGSPQTPATVTVTGAGGLNLTPTADYANNTNAGTATASYAYAETANYLSSSDSENFTIGKAATTTVVTINGGPFTYNGLAQTPATVVVTGAGGLSLTPTADYANNTNAGTATASYTYAGDDNYLSSSDSEDFTIGKATTTTTVTINGGPFAYTGSAQTPATVIVTGTGGLNLTPTADYTNNTNAGTATASYAYAGDSNYLSSSDSANFTIGKATTTTVVTISEGPFAYTGSPQTPATVTVTGAGGLNLTPTADYANNTNAGTATASYAYAETANYLSSSDSENFTIGKAATTTVVTINGGPFTYNGLAQTPATVVVTGAGGLSLTPTADYANNTNAGTATASYTYAGDDNYLSSSDSEDFTIGKATTTTTVTINGGPFAFTGLAQTPATVTVTGAGGLSLTPTSDYTNNTNAGTATASYIYAGDDNYLSSSDSANFTIEKAATSTVVTISAGPFGYTGSAQTPATVTVTGAGGLSLTPTADYANNTNAGTATASYTYAATDNYLSSSDSEDFTIGKASTTTTVTVNGGPFGYTGLAQTPATVTVTGAGGLSLTPTADYTNNTNAGTATASYTYAGDSNYLSSSDSEDFTIGKAVTTTVVTIPAGPFGYTGSAQTPATVSVTGAGGLNLTPTAVYTNNTNLGTATASYTYAATANYLSSSDSENFTIGKATSVITATGISSYTYTGSTQGPNSSEVIGSTGQVSYVYEGILDTAYPSSETKPTYAGTYQVIATVDEDENYTGASSEALVFTIGKAASTITVVGDISYVYMESAQGPDASEVTGSTGNVSYTYEGIGTTNYGPSAMLPTNAGTYQVVATLEADDNYFTASSSAFEFTIIKDFSTITVLGDLNYTYSGLEQGPNASEVMGSTGSVSYVYEGTGDTTYGPEATLPKDAGTYQVLVTVAEDDNYLGLTSDPLAFTIEKAALTITANEQSKCVGSSFSFANTEFVVEGLMEGDLVDTASMISLGSESSATVAASPYSISISDAVGSGLSNYDITYIDALMVVTPLSLAGTIAGEFGEICPDGSKILTNNDGVGAIQWEMSSNDIDFTPIEDANASEYEAVVSSNTYFRVVRTSGTCDPVISPSYLVSVASETVAGTISGGNITVCSGANNSAVLTIEGSVGSVQWMYAVTSTGTYRTIWGQTGKTLVLNNFSGNNITYYFAKVSLDCSTVVYTNKVTITALKSIAGTISGAGSLCLGNTKKLTLSGNAGKVQWQSSTDNSSFTDIAGATNTSYTTDAITESTYFRAVITNGGCESATTPSVVVTIAATIESGIISQSDMVVCRGSSASLNLTGNSSGVITWYKSVNYINATNAVPTWTIVTGQTSTVLNSGSLTVTTWYKARVNNGDCLEETPVIKVTVNPLSTVKTISGAGAICSGASKLLTLATGSVGTLQWQSSTDNGVQVPFANIVDATSSTYDASPTSSTWYRVVSTSGICSSATSVAVAVTVSQPALVGDVSTTKTEICSAGGTTLSLSSAQGSVVWQRSTVTNGVLGAFTTLIQNTTSVTTGNTLATTAYRVVVSSGVCPTATSNVVVVTVRPTSVVKTITGAGAICNGTSKVLTLATGSVGSTQWQSYVSSSATAPLSTDGNWTNIQGATDVATYTASPSATTWYRVVSTSGVCPSATSTAVAVTSSQSTSVVTLSALATTLCTGKGTTLSLTSTTGTIAWQKATVTNGVTGTFTAVRGNVSRTLATGNLTTTTAYRVVVFSGVCSTATSNVVIVTVSPAAKVAAIIGSNTTNTKVCVGASKTLTLRGGYVGTIEWLSSPTSTGTYNVIAGETASSYSYVPTSAGVMYFKVRMTSSPCSAQVLSKAVAVFADNCSSAREMTKAVVKEVVSEEFKAIAYPNPSASVFQIEVSTPSSVKKKQFNVQVYDMTGRFIEQRQVQQSENIEIGNEYPSGIYSIIVTQGEQVKTLRVIKK